MGLAGTGAAAGIATGGFEWNVSSVRDTVEGALAVSQFNLRSEGDTVDVREPLLATPTQVKEGPQGATLLLLV